MKMCLESIFGADFKSSLWNIKLSKSVLFKTKILFKKVLSATRYGCLYTFNLLLESTLKRSIFEYSISAKD